MLGALLVGLAQRACWIVLHSSGGQVARRENFFVQSCPPEENNFWLSLVPAATNLQIHATPGVSRCDAMHKSSCCSRAPLLLFFLLRCAN
jgi:hypothetical protein